MNRDILLLPCTPSWRRQGQFYPRSLVPQLQYIITLEEQHETIISLQMHAMNLKFSFKGTSHPGLLGFMNLYIVYHTQGKGWGATQ